MIFRVTAVLLFTKEDEAKDFEHDCVIALAKATTVNPGASYAERSFVEREKCHHDEAPTLSCETISLKSSP